MNTSQTDAPVDNSSSDTLMRTPPPVSSEGYKISVGPGTRSNYLHAGLIFNTAYNDNVLSGAGSNPISDMSYSIWPTIAFDQTTPRLHQTLRYSPGFTFYQRTSALNEVDQNLAFDFQYRLSPHITASADNYFRKSSNIFNQPYGFSGSPVSGSAQAPLTPVVAPIADQLTNSTNVALTYQFGRNDMVGASGTFDNLTYLNSQQVTGLYNSITRGASAFYSHRFLNAQYFGATYQHSQMLGVPLSKNQTQSETQTNTALLFYTVYFHPNLSFSLSAGPQYYDVAQSPFPESRSWTPVVAVSMGWQGRRTAFAASYSRLVSGGGGLLGAFHSNSANASFNWQLARRWSVGPAVSYAITNNVSSVPEVNPGGHIISGNISVQHPINEHLDVEFSYTRLHQSYNSIAVVSSAPDADRASISISYQFTRPLGK
ncbi:MAG TPA: hypothetical protein VHT24_04525 [Pseudacidobacterium sp.]|nr:hypothetical protein [Pseudacidobacterium sp.]